MPKIAVERTIPERPDRLYELAKDMEALGNHLPNTEEVSVVEQRDDYAVTDWTANLKGNRFAWQERETYDDEQLRIDYQQTEGDLQMFRGRWTFEADGDGTRVGLTCEFELGMPALAPVINPVAKVAVRENLEELLAGLEALSQEQ